jgi:predicted nucleic acid-binding protein
LIVVDASLALAWCFRDEQTPAAVALLSRVTADGMVVPALWHLELANVLQMAVRRKRITREQRDASMEDLQSLPIFVDEETIHSAWSTTLELADRCGLSIYDATYLELALRRNLPLATLDRQLSEAARQTRVEVLPPSAET